MILRHFFFDRESTVHGRPLRNQDSELTKQPLKLQGISLHHIKINELIWIIKQP